MYYGEGNPRTPFFGLLSLIIIIIIMMVSIWRTGKHNNFLTLSLRLCTAWTFLLSSSALLLLLLCFGHFQLLPAGLISTYAIATTSSRAIIESNELVEKEMSCDLLKGRWVRDESYPLYRSEPCPFIDGGFRCQENGRPDHDYLFWRWLPYACDLPRFDAGDMLERLRGGRMVFVGDSIARNQWESMLCMLAEAVTNKSGIYEVNGQPITKHKGYLSFRFPDHNCTIEYYRSPFLVPKTRPPPGTPKQVRLALRIDTIDWSSPHWTSADILIFNAGHWWNKDKTLKGGIYFQEGEHVNISMSVETAFAKAIGTWMQWVKRNLDPLKTQAFFLSYSPPHFRGGTWRTGGQCSQETQPSTSSLLEEEPWTNAIVRRAIIENSNNKTRNYFLSPVYLDISQLSSYRKDGHSSIYIVGKDVPRPLHREDCSHWCLPGVPDTWNHLLYASLLTHSWKRCTTKC